VHQAPGCVDRREYTIKASDVQGFTFRVPLRKGSLSLDVNGDAWPVGTFYWFPLLLKKIIHRHPPSGHSWFGVRDVSTPENDGVFGIAGLKRFDHILT
jgi:hypothetical protein